MSLTKENIVGLSSQLNFPMNLLCYSSTEQFFVKANSSDEEIGCKNLKKLVLRSVPLVFELGGFSGTWFLQEVFFLIDLLLICFSANFINCLSLSLKYIGIYCRFYPNAMISNHCSYKIGKYTL